MHYTINVDLETRDVRGGSTDCRSKLHEPLGRHFDLTVHDKEEPSDIPGALHTPEGRTRRALS
jgi:hypothetical protein